MFSLNNLVIHSYEPITEKVVGDELIIDADTKWLPICMLNKKGVMPLSDRNYKQVTEQIALAEMRNQKVKSCIECAVLCFREELELLDFMPLREVVFSNEDEDDTPEEELD